LPRDISGREIFCPELSLTIGQGAPIYNRLGVGMDRCCCAQGSQGTQETDRARRRSARAIRADREAPSLADLCARFEDEHLPKKRPKTAADYRALVENLILPRLRHHKVSEIGFADVDALHRKITKDGAPYQANRTVAVLSKMFNLAIKWGWRTDNPAKGVERNQEIKRERYLSSEELARLSDALAEYSDQQAANIIRLLLLTGARSGEVRAMRWEYLDLENGVWTKPGATTKQATLHRVPLSAPARQLLAVLSREANDDAEFVSGPFEPAANAA
jgi:integrase